MAEKIRHISPADLITVLFFAGLWIFGKTGMYNDSHQYIAMHIHREPLYSLFLWIFRTLLGEGNYLEIVRFLQNLLAAFSVIWLSSCIRKQFGLKKLMTLLVSLILLAPHVITPVFSVTRLVLSNGIVSEALVLPLFYLFIAQCIRMLFDRTKGAYFSALILSLLLSLARGQMMAAILLWMVVAAAIAVIPRVIPKNGDPCTETPEHSGSGRTAVRSGRAARAARKLFIAILATALAFGCRTLLVKSYNLAFNGHFINNTYGNVNLLANILYAADREDGELIGDEKAREFFYMSYDLAQERQANYRYAPEGFLNRAAHLEQWHDELKFNMIEQPWRDWHDANGYDDYILENVEQDRIAGIIMKSIFPAVFGRWLYGYLALSCYGLIRSVAVVHPLLNWFALAVYAGGAVLAVYTFVRNRKSKAVWVTALAFLAVAANVYATSLVIMCLSRYMIYGLPMVYIGGLLLLHENAESCRMKKMIKSEKID